MNRPARLLLDTHIWFWYVSGSPDLAPPLRDAIDDSLGSCWLSPVSIWELGVLVDRGRIRLGGPYRDWVRQALAAFPVEEAPLNFEIVGRISSLRFRHRDPADHFLAATALVYELMLVTVDGHLVGLDWLPILTV